ncbi:hypothetical protein DOTSEDRAFT_68816 [Dothistroma septosporum NZE10]|uniref:Uncharacterized protein n=1 Tax=Dothistroma septosporum (strain NZE10 / CBS 128990) TaxID=675120 RepID=N1Q494_DOTSN|nr:hypothetical protein DOTSEDRAFT_68816 [Dothistroma septosporum NZE10]
MSVCCFWSVTTSGQLRNSAEAHRTWTEGADQKPTGTRTRSLALVAVACQSDPWGLRGFDGSRVMLHHSRNSCSVYNVIKTSRLPKNTPSSR